MNEGTASDEPDFVEGLSRVLSGIRAHLSSNVMSATMGHLLVTQGSRFSFSHSFSNLLLTQLQDLINEKEVRCRFKKKTGKDGKETWWPDCFAYDYRWRPLELEKMCSYEMTMQYYMKNVTPKKKALWILFHRTRVANMPSLLE